MKFYINKFPIKNVYSLEGKLCPDIEEGKAFKVSGISCGMLELQPVENIGIQPIMIGAEMLKAGFTESEFTS